MTRKSFITKSSNGTQKFAQEFALRSKILLRRTKGSLVIALFGNLGSGKTTFVQGLALGLGVKERIISPTFIIIRQHKFNDKDFYHVDLYRVQELNELKELELEEILNNKDRIVAIEWAEKIRDLLPKKRIEIYFENLGEDKRKITVLKRL